jgi:FkbH-like protein
MSRAIFTELAWLPPPPSDFSARCRQLNEGGTDAWAPARALANYRLSETQLTRLAKAVERLRLEAKPSGLTTFRLGIVGNATTHFLVPALVATALRYGILLECVEAEFDQAMQAALDTDSSINRARCDAVLLALDHRGMAVSSPLGEPELERDAVAAALLRINAMREGLHAQGAVCIVQTVPPPVESMFGSYDYALSGTQRHAIDELNRALAQAVLGSADLLLDVAHLAETVGLAAWHDPTLWNIAKVPFAMDLLPLYADHVCRLVAALRGKSRKCLILDLDNTLWGGVIGDDGIEGIVLGQGDATGEAHLHVQRAALGLRERGIVLAVSSKNTDEVARGPFQQHPEMLLREEHIAVFQANWNDKATNIRAIAEELSLGLDAMVFLDDNPMERDLVRQMLPEVAVPELPSDPALYARTLLAAGYFEAVAFSNEDRKRAELYQDNARRVALQKQVGDVDAYLRSLDMQLTLQPFDEAGRARIAQLINKSNQFNLTTRRYTEAEVAAAERDPSAFTLQARLSDTFGDNGMISVIVCRQREDAWEIDTWLMSCRVLGRRVEEAVLAEIIARARAAGATRLLGSYLPTAKNQLVKEHYRKLGFELIDEQASGATLWQLRLDEAVLTTDLPMAIRRLDPAKRASSEQTVQVESQLAS